MKLRGKYLHIIIKNIKQMEEHNKLLTLTNLFYILLFLWYSIIFFDIPLLTTDGHARLISIYGLLELFLVIILGFPVKVKQINSNFRQIFLKNHFLFQKLTQFNDLFGFILNKSLIF